MKFVGNNLFVELPDFVAAGVSKNTVKSAYKRKSAGWIKIDDPEDKRCVLIQFNTLKEQYKQRLIAKFGDPHKYLLAENIIQKAQQTEIVKAGLENYLEPDAKELNDLYDLIDDKTKAYNIARSCAICRFYNSLPALKSELQKFGFDTKIELQKALYELVQKEKLGTFPSNYRRFQWKFTEYKEQGHQCFISKKLGNKNRAKLRDEQQLAFLRQLYARTNNYSYVRVTDDYNAAVELINSGIQDEKKRWKPLSLSAVKMYLGRPEVQKQCRGMREGYKEWRNDYDLIVHRERPSRPNLLWVEDAWTFELYYQREELRDGKRVTNHWARKVVSVVIDAYNDLIVGFCIGDKEDARTKTQAWKMAVQSAGALPYELKTDHFAEKAMRNIYEGLAKHVRLSAVGNARDKVIEPMFARMNDAVLKDYDNWSGSNITSRGKNSQPNTEKLNAIKHQFPDEAGVTGQICDVIQRWNERPTRKHRGLSLMEHWIAGDHTKDRIATRENILDIFGQLHAKPDGTPWPATLTAKGLTPTIGGQMRVYRLLDHGFHDRTGDRFTIKYDPENLDMIAATDSTGKTYYVPLDVKEKMAFGDQQEGDRARLNQKLAFKEELPKRVREANQRDMSLIQDNAVLKQFFIGAPSNKYALNEAENRMKELSQPDEYDYPQEVTERQAPAKQLTYDEYD